MRDTGKVQQQAAQARDHLANARQEVERAEQRIAELEQELRAAGDLARIDEHGQIQCLGRSDDQVKVRGFRVELGEIEAALYRQPGVGAAAVVLRDLGGIDQLVAFLKPEGEARAAPDVGKNRPQDAQGA
ncbi:hypothetical protein G6F66_014251 [Rhizopus arrhizus]|nr:hypothetical protein G6F66_014251 [Rhizopus arrhizus]